MSTQCVRSIRFVIPGFGPHADIEIYAAEDGNGGLSFTATVLQSRSRRGDLRGLFFNVNDPSKLAGLNWQGSSSSITGFQTLNVIDLGNGVNMHGKASPFHVGLRFGSPGRSKDLITSTRFTLTNTSGNLTLDDIANTQFGARQTSTGSKLTVRAPAAPNAQDDAYSIFEDGQTGLNDPSPTPAGIQFELLANDTDADGDKLRITHVEGALHGTVQIIDGDDADSLPGDAVLYTPDGDYAGQDSFTYCLTDDNGGTDFARAQIEIAAVADTPEITIEALPVAGMVNQILLRVTANQTDADSSEFIDRILATSSLPEGVTLSANLNPLSELDQYTHDFLLTLPVDQDNLFDLTFTTWSKETSNADEESQSATIRINSEYNSSTTGVQFKATDQSIWSSGDQFVFKDNRFLGIDEEFNESIGSTLYAKASGNFKLGFQSTLNFEGGEIDALTDYDVTVETNYNKTVDVLRIDTGSLLKSASFATEGPEGSYTLDFIYDLLLSIEAGINIDLGVDSINESTDFGGPIEFKGQVNLLDLNSDDLGGTIEFPDPLDSFSVSFAWPNITTSGSYPTVYPVTSSGSSNNFLDLNLDLDQLIATIASKAAGLPETINPFDPPEIDLGVAYADADILDADATLGLNFLQEFVMKADDLTGILIFENGETKAFKIGDSFILDNASRYDSEGDEDGLIEFGFQLAPEATLKNSTDLGLNFEASLSLLSIELGYDIGVYSDSTTLGPVYETSTGKLPIADINVFNSTFDLNFAQQTVSAFA